MPSSSRSSLALVCPTFTDAFVREPVRLPALERLVAYSGKSLVASTRSTALDVWQSELLSALNIGDAASYASAPLTWLGANDETTELRAKRDRESGTCLHAEPVVLAISADGLTLNLSGSWDASSFAEVELLVRDHLAALQMSWRSANGQAFLHCSAPINVQTVTARYAARGELQEALPQGPDATTLRRVMTELQMLIHEKLTYPSALNAIWLWGAGAMPQLQPKNLPLMWTNDDYTRGIYRGHTASAQCLPLPDAFDVIFNQPSGECQFVVVRKCSLEELERHWFAPALHALDRGCLQTIDVYLDGWQLHVQRSLLRRLVARARPLMESMS